MMFRLQQGWCKRIKADIEHFLDVHHSDKRRYLRYLVLVFICFPKKVPSFLKSSKTSRDPKGGDSELGAMGQCCANPQRDDFDAWKMMVVTKCTKRLSFFFEKKIDFTAIPIPNTFLEFLADKCTKQNQRWLNREPNSSDSPCLAKFGFT